MVDLAAAAPRLPQLPSLLLYTLQLATPKGGLPLRGTSRDLIDRVSSLFSAGSKCREKTSEYLNSRRDVIRLLWEEEGRRVKLH